MYLPKYRVGIGDVRKQAQGDHVIEDAVTKRQPLCIGDNEVCAAQRCLAKPPSPRGQATSASSATRSSARPFCAKEAHSSGAPRAGSYRQAAECGLHRPRYDRARNHRAGPARVPLEQDFATKCLDLTRTQLYLRLQKYGLEKPSEV